MVDSILTIVAAVLPVLIEYLDRRREEKPHAERQAILQDIARNDMDALAARIDRKRERMRKEGRVRSVGQ